MRFLLPLLCCVTATLAEATPFLLSTSTRSRALSSLASMSITTISTSPARRNCQHHHDNSSLFTLRGGGTSPQVDVSALVENSFGWASNLGAPAALIAGSVLASFQELPDAREPTTTGSPFRRRILQHAIRFLYLTAFALEVICIFVTTVTGTVLLSRKLEIMDDVVPVQATTTPLSFLHGNFEFEFLSSRVSFLQGLLHWLVGIALSHIGSGHTSIGYALLGIVPLMLSFYNRHMTFYDNYGIMLARWLHMCVRQYVWPNPPVLSLIYGPIFGMAIYHGIQTFTKPTAVETITTGDGGMKKNR